MQSGGLYQLMSMPLTTLFGTVDGHAKAGAPVFSGTAGSIVTRSNQFDCAFYAHRFYDGDGKRKEVYLGKVGDAEVEAEVARLEEAIAEVKAMDAELRLLVREGFQAADKKTFATLSSLSRHGLFAAGATLIGSHAFGVLVNQLGIRAAAYATEDVDVARREALAFTALPEKSFLEMLRDSGIHFVEVPQLDVREPSSSFKERGTSRFHVDLLVPSADDDFHLVEVKELRAHATALPYLAYVLGQTQMTTLLAREGVCLVRTPVPERFAIHKLLVSQLRPQRDAKSRKDQYQATVLLAALSELFPGAIEEAVRDLPLSARRLLRQAVPQVEAQLAAYPRGLDELTSDLA